MTHEITTAHLIDNGARTTTALGNCLGMPNLYGTKRTIAKLERAGLIEHNGRMWVKTRAGHQLDDARQQAMRQFNVNAGLL